MDYPIDYCSRMVFLIVWLFAMYTITSYFVQYSITSLFAFKFETNLKLGSYAASVQIFPSRPAYSLPRIFRASYTILFPSLSINIRLRSSFRKLIGEQPHNLISSILARYRQYFSSVRLKRYYDLFRLFLALLRIFQCILCLPLSFICLGLQCPNIILKVSLEDTEFLCIHLQNLSVHLSPQSMNIWTPVLSQFQFQGILLITLVNIRKETKFNGTIDFKSLNSQSQSQSQFPKETFPPVGSYCHTTANIQCDDVCVRCLEGWAPAAAYMFLSSVIDELLLLRCLKAMTTSMNSREVEDDEDGGDDGKEGNYDYDSTATTSPISSCNAMTDHLYSQHSSELQSRQQRYALLLPLLLEVTATISKFTILVNAADGDCSHVVVMNHVVVCVSSVSPQLQLQEQHQQHLLEGMKKPLLTCRDCRIRVPSARASELSFHVQNLRCDLMRPINHLTGKSRSKCKSESSTMMRGMLLSREVMMTCRSLGIVIRRPGDANWQISAGCIAMTSLLHRVLIQLPVLTNIIFRLSVYQWDVSYKQSTQEGSCRRTVTGNSRNNCSSRLGAGRCCRVIGRSFVLTGSFATGISRFRCRIVKATEDPL